MARCGTGLTRRQVRAIFLAFLLLVPPFHSAPVKRQCAQSTSNHDVKLNGACTTSKFDLVTPTKEFNFTIYYNDNQDKHTHISLALGNCKVEGSVVVDSQHAFLATDGAGYETLDFPIKGQYVDGQLVLSDSKKNITCDPFKLSETGIPLVGVEYKADDQLPAFEVVFADVDIIFSAVEPETAADWGPGGWRLWLTVAGAIAVVIVVIALVICCYKKYKAKKSAARLNKVLVKVENPCGMPTKTPANKPLQPASGVPQQPDPSKVLEADPALGATGKQDQQVQATGTGAKAPQADGPAPTAQNAEDPAPPLGVVAPLGVEPVQHDAAKAQKVATKKKASAPLSKAPDPRLSSDEEATTDFRQHVDDMLEGRPTRRVSSRNHQRGRGENTPRDPSPSLKVQETQRSSKCSSKKPAKASSATTKAPKSTPRASTNNTPGTSGIGAPANPATTEGHSKTTEGKSKTEDAQAPPEELVPPPDRFSNILWIWPEQTYTRVQLDMMVALGVHVHGQAPLFYQRFPFTNEAQVEALNSTIQNFYNIVEHTEDNSDPHMTNADLFWALECFGNLHQHEVRKREKDARDALLEANKAAEDNNPGVEADKSGVDAKNSGKEAKK